MILVEPCAGSAALTRHLIGMGPLVGYAGGKDGYAHAIAEVMGIAGRRPDRVVLADPGRWGVIWKAVAQGQLALVAEEIEAFADWHPRRLWEHLCSAPGLGCKLPTLAARELLRISATHGGHEIGGFKGRHKRRPNVDGYIPSRRSLARRCREAATIDLPPIVVFDSAADLLQPGPGLWLERADVYVDPPYRGVTGYIHDLPRAAVVAFARQAQRLGADSVAVSEAEPIEELHDWAVVEITAARRGQGRRKSATREFLTCI